MELIPSIDLLSGQVVRLAQGDYARVTVYPHTAPAAAQAFAQAGAERLHVVDLDGARDGAQSGALSNREAIAAIVAQRAIRVQIGGGIRSAAAAAAWLELGADRVVVGTAAVREPAWVEALCRQHPGRVVVALDAKGSEVVVEGWTAGSGEQLHALAKRVDAWGPAALLYTAVQRDGMGQGPDVAATAALQATVQTPVIASGGIGSIADLLALQSAGIRAAVCGRALHAGQIDLQSALGALRAS